MSTNELTPNQEAVTSPAFYASLFAPGRDDDSRGSNQIPRRQICASRAALIENLIFRQDYTACRGWLAFWQEEDLASDLDAIRQEHEAWLSELESLAVQAIASNDWRTVLNHLSEMMTWLDCKDCNVSAVTLDGGSADRPHSHDSQQNR